MSINEGLRARSTRVFDDALLELRRNGGPDAEAAVCAAIPDLEPVYRRLVAVIALGDMTGSHGPETLRTVIKEGPNRDLRCAGVIALAKRCGQKASADYMDALGQRDSVVQDYALIALAGAGDDRAWEAVVAKLPRLLRRTGRGMDPAVSLFALAYLGQYLSAARQTKVEGIVNRKTGGLKEEEAEWAERFWPSVIGLVGCEPDPAELRAWARDPLLLARRGPI